jgi:hypothetical protein
MIPNFSTYNPITLHLSLRLRQKSWINRTVNRFVLSKMPFSFSEQRESRCLLTIAKKRSSQVHYLMYANVYLVNFIPPSILSEGKFLFCAETVNETRYLVRIVSTPSQLMVLSGSPEHDPQHARSVGLIPKDSKIICVKNLKSNKSLKFCSVGFQLMMLRNIRL